MYEAILVPTDGSDEAAKAVDHALRIAEAFGATVHALYVVDVSVMGIAAPEADVEPVIEGLEAQGRRATKTVAEQMTAAGIPCETAVETGTPYRAILRYASDHDIDLIVMGTHGRTGLDRVILGSVTERVVRTSPVPVLTVRLSDPT